MAEEVKVKPTPIQRNSQDVAMELLNIYLKDQYSTDKPVTAEELSDIYLKFYSMARAAESTHYKKLEDYLPEKLKEMVK